MTITFDSKEQCIFCDDCFSAVNYQMNDISVESKLDYFPFCNIGKVLKCDHAALIKPGAIGYLIIMQVIDRRKYHLTIFIREASD